MDEMVSTIKATSNKWTLKFKTRLYATGLPSVAKLDEPIERIATIEEENEEEAELESENEKEA
jgi:hypothetical protein